MYQALYRKWRPRVFADVIGQQHVTRTLRKQVAEGRTSHAYLFTGTRGTGKTTCAKILSRAVNCEHPIDGDPCCACPSCIGLENGSFLDVLELDAASNNGVDQVRALRDEAIYAPANVKTRVYIVDEVHMLSIAAFNALLKILEEPPEHLMFILATTELHKVPATILSRCQRYAFRRILPEDIAARLSYVAGQEQIDLTPDGAELLARLADGAMRDGLSLLDQCAASGGTVDSAAVLDILGLAGHLQTAELLEDILRRDVPAALELFDSLYQNGKDAGTVLGELSTLVRDLLLRRSAPQGSAALLSGGYDAATLDRLGRAAPSKRLFYLASAMQKAAAGLFSSVNRRLDVELCLLRCCDETLSGDLDALAGRVERLETELEKGAFVSNMPVSNMPVSNMPVSVAAPVSGNISAAPVAAPVSVEETRVEAPRRMEPDDMPPLPDEPPPEDTDNAPPYDMPPWADDAPPLPENMPPWSATPQPLTRQPPLQGGPMVEGNAPLVEENAKPPFVEEDAKPPFVEEDAKPPFVEEDAKPPLLRGGRGGMEPSFKAAIPAAAPPVSPSAPPPVSNEAWWAALSERCKPKLPVFMRSFFSQCTGVLEGDLLTLYAPNAIVLGRIDNDRVRGLLLEEAGGAARISIREGEPPKKSPAENLRQLVHFVQDYDNIQVVGTLPENGQSPAG